MNQATSGKGGSRRGGSRTAPTIVIVLLLALFLRVRGAAWDGLQQYHPDERYVAWVGTSMAWAGGLQPEKSQFNPYFWPAEDNTVGVMTPQSERRDFAYGHLPLYVGVAVAQLLASWLQGSLIEFDYVTLVGRIVTALFDVGTVGLVFWLGKALYDEWVGLLAALFLALNAMHIQLSHFFATDPYMTFFVVASVCAVVRALRHQQKKWLVGAGVLAGLAVGSKFSAVVLGLPLWVGVGLVSWPAAETRAVNIRQVRNIGCWVGLAAVVAFGVTNPFAVLDFGCEAITPATIIAGLEIPALDWKSCFLANIGQQSVMVGGSAAFPFTWQYEGTRPYLYFAEMQLRWGMGWPLGIVALAGLLVACLRVGRGLFDGSARDMTWRGEVVVLAWVLPYLLYTGGFYVKFMRYMMPITPFLVLWGAAWVWRLGRWRYAVAGVVGVATLGYALAFSQMYARPHPWLLASAWLHQNAPAGAVITSELWDEPLPSSMDVAGEWRSRGAYEEVVLTWLSRAGAGDNEAKLAQNLQKVAAADYVVVASNRVYGVVSRLPELYPLSGRFHARLFDGSLGYELVFVADRPMGVGSVTFVPNPFAGTGVALPAGLEAYWAEKGRWLGGRADESFTVYDQPVVMIFENRGRLSGEEMTAVVTDR